MEKERELLYCTAETFRQEAERLLSYADFIRELLREWEELSLEELEERVGEVKKLGGE